MPHWSLPCRTKRRGECKVRKRSDTSHIQATQIATVIVALALLVGCSDPHLIPNIPPPVQPTVGLKVLNYCPQNNFVYTETFATNTSSELVDDVWATDSDRDGLSDVVEGKTALVQQYHIGMNSQFTNGSAYTDLITYTLGVSAVGLVSLMGVNACSFPATQDTDYDGLTDCDEGLLHTDRLNPDTDADGIPDGLEVRFGTNPLDVSDGTTDVDWDQYSNIQEIKMNTPVSVSNSGNANAQAIQYDMVQTASGLNPCYELTITNIPVVQVSNGNLVRIFATESKPVVGHPNAVNVSTVSVLIPQNIENGVLIEVNGLNHQILDGISTPLVIVPK